MRILLRILLVLLIAEAAIAGTFVIGKLRQSPVPLPDAADLDPMSRQELQDLIQAAHLGDLDEWLQLADALVGKGYYVHAEQCYRHILSQSPQHPEALGGLAFCLDRTGRIEESNRYYRQLLDLTNGDVRQHYLFALGRNALRLEDQLQAEEYFQQNQDFIPARLMLNKLLVKTGRAELAMPQIEKFLETLPQSLLFQRLRYEASLQLQQEQKAQQAAAAMEQSELLIPINFHTGFLSQRNQQYGFNRLFDEYFQSAEFLQPEQKQRVLQELQEYLGSYLSPYTLILTLKQAEVAVEQKDKKALRENLEKLAQWGETNATILRLKGDLAALENNPEQAVQFWQRSLAMTESQDVHKKLAEEFGRQQQTQRRDEHLAAINLIQGQQAYWNNKPAEAQPLLQKALELNPQSATAWYYLGKVAQAQAQPAEAQKALEKCLSINPYHGRAKRDLHTLTAN